MLTLTLVCVGRLKAGAERDLAERYLERARVAGRALGLSVECREIAESKARRPADRKVEEADAVRAAIGAATRIVFDETGRALDSESFAGIVRGALDNAQGPQALIIGGPDGLDPTFRAGAAHIVALGKMTWPHQLVRVMAAEQIYRAVTILSGHPYHRA